MYSCLRNRCRRRSRFLDCSTALLYSLWRTWWVWEDIPSRLRPPFNFAENRERGKKEVNNYQQYCYHQAFLLQTRVTSHLLHVWVVPAWVLSVPSMFTVFKNKNECPHAPHTCTTVSKSPCPILFLRCVLFRLSYLSPGSELKQNLGVGVRMPLSLRKGKRCNSPVPLLCAPSTLCLHCTRMRAIATVNMAR